MKYVNAVRQFFVPVAMLAALFLMSGCIVTPPAYYDDSVVVYEAPPPPRHEVIVAAPSPVHVWIGGYWAWDNHWAWRPGHWAPRPHPRARWTDGSWHRRGKGWAYAPGRWH